VFFEEKVMVDQTNTFVLSVGGSLIVPGGIVDTKFLSEFNAFIRNQVSAKKRRFFIVIGGGSIAGKYIEAAKDVRGKELTDADKDWLGIHATRLNAQLVRTVFQDIADPRVIKHYEIILKIEKPVAIAAGWKPGWSTDYDAVTLCADYGVREVVNLTNIDKVYNKDPNKFTDAKPINTITWKKYRAMVGNTWSPRMSAPFDPIASKLAQELGVTVKILNGKDLNNLAKALDNKEFHGTTIA
jgi:uridylate kinase